MLPKDSKNAVLSAPLALGASWAKPGAVLVHRNLFLSIPVCLPDIFCVCCDKKKVD